MPVSNTTEAVRISSAWLLVAQQGDVMISGSDPFSFAITPTAGAGPTSDDRGHPADSGGDGNFRMDIRLDANQFLWVRTPTRDADIYMTATNPV